MVVGRTTQIVDNLIPFSDDDLKSRPFDYQTSIDHLNARLIGYSDPHNIFPFLAWFFIDEEIAIDHAWYLGNNCVFRLELLKKSN